MSAAPFAPRKAYLHIKKYVQVNRIMSKKLGIALGGGGARGVAHIGFLTLWNGHIGVKYPKAYNIFPA